MSAGFTAWLVDTPLWAIALTLLVAMTVVSLAGYLVRRRQKRKLAETGKAVDDEESFVLTSVLGLLALLMGFTFSLALDRFETRRALVIEEANTIGTTYLRAQLLEEPHRSQICGLLVQYVDNRLAFSHRLSADAQPFVERDRRLVTELWTATVAAFPTIRATDFSTAFLDSMNGLIELDEARQMARLAKVPYEVYLVLFVYIIASSGLVGYTLDGPRERSAAAFLFLLLTLALILMIDIDRPGSGWITESQRPLENLQAALRDWPPGVFDPPAVER